MSDIIINGTTYNGINSISANTTDGGVATYTEGGNSNTYQITSYNDLYTYLGNYIYENKVPKFELKLKNKGDMIVTNSAHYLAINKTDIEEKTGLTVLLSLFDIKFYTMNGSLSGDLCFTGNNMCCYMYLDPTTSDNVPFNSNVSLLINSQNEFVLYFSGNIGGTSSVNNEVYFYYIGGELPIDLNNYTITLTIYE